MSITIDLNNEPWEISEVIHGDCWKFLSKNGRAIVTLILSDPAYQAPLYINHKPDMSNSYYGDYLIVPMVTAILTGSATINNNSITF